MCLTGHTPFDQHRNYEGSLENVSVNRSSLDFVDSKKATESIPPPTITTASDIIADIAVQLQRLDLSAVDAKLDQSAARLEKLDQSAIECPEIPSLMQGESMDGRVENNKGRPSSTDLG